MPPAPMPPPTSGGQPSMTRIFPHSVHFAYRSPSSVWNARHRCQPREHLIRFTATQAYAAGSGDAFLNPADAAVTSPAPVFGNVTRAGTKEWRGAPLLATSLRAPIEAHVDRVEQ